MSREKQARDARGTRVRQGYLGGHTSWKQVSGSGHSSPKHRSQGKEAGESDALSPWEVRCFESPGEMVTLSFPVNKTYEVIVLLFAEGERQFKMGAREERSSPQGAEQ